MNDYPMWFVCCGLTDIHWVWSELSLEFNKNLYYDYMKLLINFKIIICFIFKWSMIFIWSVLLMHCELSSVNILERTFKECCESKSCFKASDCCVV